MSFAAQLADHVAATASLLDAAAALSPESKRILVESEIRAAILRLEGALAMVAESSDELHVELARAERDGDIATTERVLDALAARSRARLGVCSEEGNAP